MDWATGLNNLLPPTDALREGGGGGGLDRMTKQSQPVKHSYKHEYNYVNTCACMAAQATLSANGLQLS